MPGWLLRLALSPWQDGHDHGHDHGQDDNLDHGRYYGYAVKPMQLGPSRDAYRFRTLACVLQHV